MSASQTPQFSYSYSTDFDYRHYLEEKSHFDRIELSVDSGIRKLITSNENMARLGIQSSIELGNRIDAVGQKIDYGFERLSVSLDAVKGSIDDLRFVCEYGFGEISLGLNNIDLSLKRLIKIAENPDQTWELEQFRRAQDAFKRNLFEDALDYINRAIDGYGERSGYRLDHRFHMLRGLVHLGNYKNYSSTLVDLKAAERDFQAAAKYAEHVDPIDRSRSYGLAGWTAYCMGEMNKAEDYLQKSLKINSSDIISQFDLAKLLFRAERFEDAIKVFSAVIRVDYNYALRAAADPDFLAKKSYMLEVIESYRSQLQSDLRKSTLEYDRLSLGSKYHILKKHGFDPSSERNLLDSAKNSIATSAVSDLISMRDKAPSALSSLREGLNTAKNRLEDIIRSERQRPTKSVFSGNGSSDGSGFVWSFVGVVLGGAIGIYWYVSSVHHDGHTIFRDSNWTSDDWVLIFRPFIAVAALVLGAIAGAVGFPALMMGIVLPFFRIPQKMSAEGDRNNRLKDLEGDLEVLRR